MKPVLIDTSCIVALLDRSDHFHPRCREVIADINAPVVTCEPVIAETCYLLRHLRGAADAVLQNVDQGVFEIPFILSSEADRLRKLMDKYFSIPMDLADACLVRLAELYETPFILTLDQDFDIYRWKARRGFQNLLFR